MLIKRIFSVLAVFTVPAFAVCVQGPGNFMGKGAILWGALMEEGLCG